MTQNIFEFEDYRDYLNHYLQQLPKRGHGFRSRMAEAMKCEGSYVSRVLNQHAHIQLEQAEALSQLLEHTPEEFDFFVAMVQLARAGTPTLKRYFKKQMSTMIERRTKIRNRIRPELPLSLEQQTRYFSHWQYAAVHMLLLIPELQSREKLQERLKISPKRLSGILDFLIEAALIEEKAGKYRIGPAVVQLPGDSPLAIQNHANWRHHAIQVIENESDHGLHYSSVMTMSAEDAKKIHEMYIQAIEKMNRIVDHSANETSVALILDCFEI